MVLTGTRLDVGARRSGIPFDLRDSGSPDDPLFDRPLIRGTITPDGGVIETLAAALRDFAEHGGRFEAQPCLLMRQIDGTFYMQAEMVHDYLRRFDAGIRERAKRTLAAMGVEVVGRG